MVTSDSLDFDWSRMRSRLSLRATPFRDRRYSARKEKPCHHGSVRPGPFPGQPSASSARSTI